MMMNFKSIAVLSLSLLALKSFSQIKEGKIIFERKTNLYKKFKEDRDIENWIKPEDKNKVDVFELYFNDSLAVFKPQESELKEQMSWATSKNTSYQNLKKRDLFIIKSIWGEKLYVTDTLRKRAWKITDSKRNIGGYSCRKAIWQADDSTKIYAWYAEEIEVSSGPESYGGLPGMILGLASEDGGIIYFAKSVEQIKPSEDVLRPVKGKNKIYTSQELRTKLEKDFGKEKWGKAMIKNVFGYW